MRFCFFIKSLIWKWLHYLTYKTIVFHFKGETDSCLVLFQIQDIKSFTVQFRERKKVWILVFVYKYHDLKVWCIFFVINEKLPWIAFFLQKEKQNKENVWMQSHIMISMRYHYFWLTIASLFNCMWNMTTMIHSTSNEPKISLVHRAY